HMPPWRRRESPGSPAPVHPLRWRRVASPTSMDRAGPEATRPDREASSEDGGSLREPPGYDRSTRPRRVSDPPVDRQQHVGRPSTNPRMLPMPPPVASDRSSSRERRSGVGLAIAGGRWQAWLDYERA